MFMQTARAAPPRKYTGVHLAAMPGRVFIILRGMSMPITPRLAREMAVELTRYAQTAEDLELECYGNHATL